MRANTGTGMALYRGLQDPVQFADAGLGFRTWGFDMNLSLNPGQLPAAAVSRSAGWTDPMIGARYHRELGNGRSLTATAISVVSASLPISIGRRSRRSITPSIHRGICTSAIAA